jgi:hypothetical protein
MASAQLGIPDHGPAQLLLESLRRDAYVMEANAYGTPTITKSEYAFAVVFQQLYRQLQGVFGPELKVVVAIEAHGKSREALAAFKGSDVSEFKRTSTAPETLTQLNGFVAPPDSNPVRAVWGFASSICTIPPTWSQEPDEFGIAYTALIAPYLVRRIKDKPPTDLDTQLSTWQPCASDLMFTRPYQTNRDCNPQITVFADAYYAAVLLLFVPTSIALTNAHLDWLEAFHTAFQMSWGFPALGEELRAKEKAEEKSEEMRRQATRDEEIRTRLKTIAGKIERQLNDIRKETDQLSETVAPSSIGLDNTMFADLFKGDRNRSVWEGSDFSVKPRHDYSADPQEGPALVHYGIFRLLHAIPETRMTCAALRESAVTLIDKTLSPQRELLERLVEADEHAFNLLKELTYNLNIRGREVSFYAIAVRLLLCPVGENFQVVISDASLIGEKTITLNNQTLVQASCHTFDAGPFSPSLFMKPSLPGIPTCEHRNWVMPMVDLIGNELQRSKARPHNKVAVTEVRMTRLDNQSKIECQLAADRADDIDNVLRLLEQSETDGHGGHGLRTQWMHLYEFRDLLNPIVDKKTAQITFCIEGSR